MSRVRRDGVLRVASAFPDDVLLAEDTAGGGHEWRPVDDGLWTRVYVQLPAP